MEPVNGQTPSKATIAAQDRFVLEWGRMSSSWGINRTMAQIHALLIITGESLTMDQIIERLHISRGNASMNLRDLCDWGVVYRTRNPGDRKDLYAADPDVVQMFGRVVTERKRREIDPTVAAIRDCLAIIPDNDLTSQACDVRKRLATLLEIFDLIDRVFNQFLSNEARIQTTISELRKTPDGISQAISQSEPADGGG